MVWLVPVLGGVLIAAHFLVDPHKAVDEEERRKLAFEQRKRRQEYEQERKREQEEARENALAFWASQVGLVGNYHLKGMPKGAKLTRLLRAVEDQQLVLQGAQHTMRVLWWYVLDYAEFTPPPPNP